MTDTITLTGLVATQPRHITTNEGLAITSFRLASAQRRFDRAQERWIDADTNWYTITAFRQLAVHSAVSIKKGERVIVSGRLRIREWENGERNGMNIDIEADSLGHDLLWGTSVFSRTISTSAVSESPAGEAGAADAGGTGGETEGGAEGDTEATETDREAVSELEAALPY